MTDSWLCFDGFFQNNAQSLASWSWRKPCKYCSTPPESQTFFLHPCCFCSAAISRYSLLPHPLDRPLWSCLTRVERSLHDCPMSPRASFSHNSNQNSNQTKQLIGTSISSAAKKSKPRTCIYLKNLFCKLFGYIWEREREKFKGQSWVDIWSRNVTVNRDLGL